MTPPVVLATDFGWYGPYVGQMKCSALKYSPRTLIIDLIHDLPSFNVRSASYLLASYCSALPAGAVVVAVVDPGVGSKLREPVIVVADGRYFVGPGNGIFDQIISQAKDWHYWQITWRPEHLSATFHGRDLFMPVAVMIAAGMPLQQLALPAHYAAQGWPTDLAEIIYIDHYGNAQSGLRANYYAQYSSMLLDGIALRRASTFADVAVGQPFFYENSNGLLEIAVNQGRAAEQLRLAVGTPLSFV